MNSDTKYFDGGKTKQKRSLKLRPGGTTQIRSVLLLLLLTFAEHPPPLECSVDRADRSSPCSPRFARATCFLPVVSPTSAGLKWVLITVLIDAGASGPFENRPTATACISTPSMVRHDICRPNYAVERGLVVGFCAQPHYCYRPYYPTARFPSPLSYAVSDEPFPDRSRPMSC